MFNKAILMGNLGKDAELITFADGNSIASFSLATNKSYKDKNDEWQKKTVWHNIVIKGRASERAGKLEKGNLVLIEGEINNRSYDKDGVTKYITEVVSTFFRKLDRNPEGSSERYSEYNNNEEKGKEKEGSEGEDDMPF